MEEEEDDPDYVLKPSKWKYQPDEPATDHVIGRAPDGMSHEVYGGGKGQQEDYPTPSSSDVPDLKEKQAYRASQEQRNEVKGYTSNSKNIQ